MTLASHEVDGIEHHFGEQAQRRKVGAGTVVVIDMESQTAHQQTRHIALLAARPCWEVPIHCLNAPRHDASEAARGQAETSATRIASSEAR